MGEGRRAPFVGRESELARAATLVEDVAAGEGRLLLLSGEPGIGKTRLAQSVERLAGDRGFRVVWGRCWEAGGAPAFWPWSQVFASLGLPDPFDATGTDAVVWTGDLRFRLFERARQVLAERAAAEPMAILLDDVHAADVASLGLLHVVARSIRTAAMLVVVTFREAEARVSPSGALLSKIAREGEAIALDRLAPGDVEAWVRAAAPEAANDFAERLHALSEGNPLFVHELLRVTRREGQRLPDGLRAVLDEHLALVSSGTRAVLQAATVFGRDARPDDIAVVAGLTEDAVVTHLREAADAGLVDVRADRYFFTHVLLRDRLYADLAPSEKGTLHWRAGERLVSRGDIVAAAHHLLEGVAHGAVRAAEVAREAATTALKRLAFEDAAALADRAIAVLGASADAGSTHAAKAISCELEIVRAEARIRMGDRAAGQVDCIRAAALARSIGSAALEARAALAYGAEIISALVDTTMVQLLRDALSSLRSGEDEKARARVLARLSAAIAPPSDEAASHEMIRLAREAAALARSLGDDETSLYVSVFVTASIPYHVPRDENIELTRDGVARARKLDQPLVILQLGGWWMASMREFGHLADAQLAVDTYEKALLDLPLPQYRWRLPLMRSTLAILAGDLDAADRLGREAREIIDAAQSSVGLLGWAQHRVALALAKADPWMLLPHADEVMDVLDRRDVFAPWVAWVLAATGRKDEARERLKDYSFGVGRYPASLIAAETAMLLEDRELAARVLDGLEGHRGLVEMFWGGPAGTACIGPATRLRGDLARLLGRSVEARRHYEEAQVSARLIGALPHLALVRRGMDQLGHAAPPSRRSSIPAPRDASISFTQKGDMWTIASFTGATVRLKDGKAIRYLRALVEQEGREVHAMDLAQMDEPPSDAGAILDPKAKEAYRRRLRDLAEELDEAQGFADAGRADRARTEIEALTQQLASAIGLGGRERKAGSLAERARINVQRRLRAVITQIGEQDPALGQYLSLAVHTGTFCSFKRL